MISQLFNVSKRVLLSRTTRMLALVVGAGLFLGTNLGFGCTSSSGGGDPGVISVPLEYRASDNDRPPIINIPNRNQVKVLVSAADKRDEAERNSLGFNRQDRNEIPVRVGGSAAVPDFVTKVTKAEVRDATLGTTDDMAQCTHMLNIDVITFNVLEDNMFNAEVRLEARLIDPTSKELWRGSGSGTSKTFGRSKNPENYQQVLSNATKAAVDQILSDPGLKAALSGGEAK
jgi:hypothetical protein